MEKIKEDLNLSDKYKIVNEELFKLNSELINNNIQKNSDTVEVLLLIKENKQILNNKFKQNYLFTESHDIIRYFKTNFPNLNENKVKKALIKYGYIPSFITYWLLALLYTFTYFLILNILNINLPLLVDMLFVVICAFFSIISLAFLYPSKIKPNIY